MRLYKHYTKAIKALGYSIMSLGRQKLRECLSLPTSQRGPKQARSLTWGYFNRNQQKFNPVAALLFVKGALKGGVSWFAWDNREKLLVF